MARKLKGMEMPKKKMDDVMVDEELELDLEMPEMDEMAAEEMPEDELEMPETEEMADELEKFSDEDLMAELEKRGLLPEKSEEEEGEMSEEMPEDSEY